MMAISRFARDVKTLIQAFDSFCDGTKTQPSSLAAMFVLLFCRLYGICGAVVALEAADEALVVVDGTGGGLEFNLMSSSCRLRFA